MSDRSGLPARPARTWKPTTSFWIVAAIVLFFAVIFAFAGGAGGVLLVLGIVAVLTALYAAIFKRRSWVGLPHRKSALLVGAAGVVAFIVGGGVLAATAAPSGNTNKVGLASTSQQTASATPTPTTSNPARTACLTIDETRSYQNEKFVCVMGSDQRLVWMSQADATKLAEAKKVEEKAAADKIAADKLAAEKAAADKAAADKLVADQAAKAEADRLAAEQTAKAEADRLAAEQAPQAPAAPAPAVPAPAAPAPGYVTPGAFCSGGTGVSKTGKAMICAPASDGKLRWRSA